MSRRKGSLAEGPSEDDAASSGERDARLALIWLGGPALVGLFVYLWYSSGKVFALGILTAAAAFAVGAVIGFLFGIPRSLAAPVTSVDQGGTRDPDSETATEEFERHFAPNSNLEQISDWLTKILVGVGLVQLHQISDAVGTLASGLAPGLGGADYGYQVAVALLITFSITGFLSAYLYTRLHLQNAFELALLIKKAITKRVDADAKATAMVQQQLTPGADRIGLDALTKGLKAATTGIRTQAFFLARKQRFEDWREGTEEEQKEFAGLGMPVFEALIALDPEGHYYRSRAELGYALLLQEPPRFADARTAFDEAIELRPAEQDGRTRMYEFSRAFCNIELDRGWRESKPSSEQVVEVACADIEAGLDVLDQVDKSRLKVVRRWLELNSTGSSPVHERVRELLEKFP